MSNRTIPVIITAAVTSVVTLFAAARLQQSGSGLFGGKEKKAIPVNYAGFNRMASVSASAPVDFEPAAEASVQAVVHIKTTTNRQVHTVKDDFWGGQYYAIQPEQRGAGSGVVVSDDGYIVTNNHVVAGTDVVTVTFNDRFTTKAKVVGTDPSTDIAVLKVEEKELPFMEFGNSDDVRLGQWVLAVGYPFTLDATVTAGIVSAKARSIGINSTRAANAVESFIQTDAAVNPGNSGGALVNMKGQLIGINSAIASPTGAYAGYSYSIPANLVRKVVNDIIATGSVQRGYLGIQFFDRRNLTPEKMTELGIDRNEGVYVAGIQPGSGAEEGGLKKGDFITRINDLPVRTEPELLEKVATYKPGDHISVTYLRSGETYKTTVQLKKLSTGATQLLGANFRELSDSEKKELGVSSGLLVTEINDGPLAEQTQMKKNFVLRTINSKQVKTVNELQQIVEQARRLEMAGIYPGSRSYYYYGVDLQ